jgi:hypothetical protein
MDLMQFVPIPEQTFNQKRDLAPFFPLVQVGPTGPKSRFLKRHTVASKDAYSAVQKY